MSLIFLFLVSLPFWASEEFWENNLVELCRKKWILSCSINLVESSVVNGIKGSQNVGVLILTDSFMQNLLKKHEALDNDFAVHEVRVQNVCAQGEDILSKVRDSGDSKSNFHFQKQLAQI